MNYDMLKEKLNEKFKRYNIDIHSYAIMHHEDIVLEHYNEPFSETFLHRLYSATKTFAGIAIGKLADEGKISLDKPISSYFEDKFDMSQTHPYVKEVTVRDALMMSTCYCVSAYTPRDKNWLECFFKAKPSHPAGMLWCYDSAGTYALGGLVQHITGKDVLEYLRPVLDEIGFSKEAYMIKGPDGEAWTSSALVATTRILRALRHCLPIMVRGTANSSSRKIMSMLLQVHKSPILIMAEKVSASGTEDTDIRFGSYRIILSS